MIVNTSVNTFKVTRKTVNKVVIVLFCVMVFVTTSPMTLAEVQEEQEGEVVIVSVDSTNLRFSPETITLNEGDTVRFLWNGELLAHNAVEENGLFDSGNPSRNVDYSYTFSIGENGTYEYVCEPHEDVGMIGTIVVEPMPIIVDENETEDEEENVSEVQVGEGNISLVLFSPWLLGVILFVGYIALHRDRFQLSVVLEEDSEDIENIDTSSEGETLVESYRARVLTLCALYVAQGIPWGFITVTFVTFLAARGVSAGELALLLTLGTLPWSVKFLWGPIIDRYQIPTYGRRRPWILLAQTGMIMLLIAMLFVPDPASNVQTIAMMFLVYNVFTSLQDVSTDALAVDVLKPHEMEKVNSYMFTSKTLGGVIGGAGLGTIIVYTGFKGAILLQIPILLGIMLAPLLMTERPGERRFPWESKSDSIIESYNESDEAITTNENFAAIINKILTAFSLRSARLSIVLSLTVSLSFLLIPILPLLFVLELGWTEAQFNATRGGWILVVTMVGYLVGGQLGRRFGGKSIIIYGALATALSTSLWGLFEGLWDNATWMVGIWSLRTFGWSVVMINIYSLVMKVTWGEVGGTQFTGYMAMMNLSAIIGYQLTGPLASRFDYQTLLLIGAVLETLVILAVLWIDPDETRRTLDNSSSMSVVFAEILEDN